MSRRERLGLMPEVDAIHCLYMAKGKDFCPTCGEDLRVE